ncbi:MAG: hypothetical protein RL757_1899 [Bacteroidota bacterium]|jgi:homoserine O-acetyltransferase
MLKIFKSETDFLLESGKKLAEIEIGYQTWGTLNAEKNNVIWVFHAFTGDADALNWWAGLLGDGKIFDPKDYFIVCANILGSCYGSTSPMHVNPETNQIYATDFPLITIRDLVKAHILLANHLSIEKIYLSLGGSMGGQQALEWAIEEPTRFDNLALIACGAKMSAWAIAQSEAQRMAIRPTLPPPPVYLGKNEAELQILFQQSKGIEAARAIAMLSYRSYESYILQQTETSDELLTDFKAASYQRYQGEKLRKRFNPLSYISISNTMDTHNVARNRGNLREVLATISAKTLVVGIESDGLFPKEEQAFLAAHITGATFVMIESPYGHDGFLIEFEQLQRALKAFLHAPALRRVA